MTSTTTDNGKFTIFRVPSSYLGIGMHIINDKGDIFKIIEKTEETKDYIKFNVISRNIYDKEFKDKDISSYCTLKDEESTIVFVNEKD